MGQHGKTFDAGYATIKGADDGTNYREIAELMTIIGFPMNHSSARNHVVRAMQKFATKICEQNGLRLSEEESLRIARDPRFQDAMSEILQYVEVERRSGVTIFT